MPLPSHYHDPDATFARHFATLRTDLGLTQTALAERLGVTERAIQRWEGGTRSPRAAYLKSFLALCIEQHLFPESQEVEQARTLWKAAHLKVLLDERWLLGLLDKQAPPPVESAREIMPVPQEAMHPLDLRKNSSEISFYGREHEQAQLTTWIREDRCRLIALLGMGGIGKSSLATRLLHQLAPFFTTTTFRSVRDAMPCEELIAHLIQALAPEEPLAQVPSTLDRQMTLLIDLLQQRRCLVVIDNVETLLQEGEHAGRYRPGYEEYGRFFERVGSTQHQSCVLLTSREKPVEFHAMEGSRTPVRALSLAGLDAGAGAQILVEKHLHGKEEERRRLIEVYSGNPLALKIVAETIHELFADEIAPFLTEGQVIFQGIRALLAQQFTRLTFLEQSIMFWLAIVREPVDVSTLLTRSVTKMPRLHVLEALEDLRRRSLVEHGSQRSLFTLQAVVMEYVTETLVKQMALEVQQRAPDALLIYGLSLASAKEYIRQSQERLLLIPVLFHLGATSHRKGVVEQHLLACLNSLRSSYEIEEQGYGPANLAMLLLHLKGHLQGLDFSGCGLREAALQGVQMQDASLHKSLMQENSFTDTFGAVFTVVVSHDGKYWALGSDMGQLYVFLHESGTPVLALNPHPGVRSIAFNADSTRMATSGRDDDLIKIWSLPQGTLIATLQGHSIDVRDIAFSPDGTRLAATGLDGTVRIWDLESLQVRHLLHSHKREVYAVAWSNDGQLLATAGEDSIHLWDGHSGRKIRTLVDQSNITLECAFSPDNRLLASGGTDKFVKVWDVASGVCLQSLAGHTHVVISVAWNPDGSFLASGSFDMTIRIWHAHSFALRQILSGHSSVVMSIAFTADGTRLFSGSFDRSVRLWEVASGDCISLITGFSLFCRAAAWSLRGDLLATTITDGRIMLWNPAEGTLVRVLQGHTQPLSSVTWSPDGQLLASGGGHDKTVRLWKTNTGECILTVNDIT